MNRNDFIDWLKSVGFEEKSHRDLDYYWYTHYNTIFPGQKNLCIDSYVNHMLHIKLSFICSNDNHICVIDSLNFGSYMLPPQKIDDFYVEYKSFVFDIIDDFINTLNKLKNE